METDGVLASEAFAATLDQTKLEQDFDRILGMMGPALGRLAASYTNTASDRDDLLQEIAMAVWQALRRFRGECSERTFVFRVAHNRAIGYLARNRSRKAEASEEFEVADPGPDPEAGLAREQRSQRLRHAVQSLPVLYRQVITLTLEGLGYEEIAEVLGISESNVGARLSRARQMLREAMELRQ